MEYFVTGGDSGGKLSWSLWLFEVKEWHLFVKMKHMLHYFCLDLLNYTTIKAIITKKGIKLMKPDRYLLKMWNFVFCLHLYDGEVYLGLVALMRKTTENYVKCVVCLCQFKTLWSTSNLYISSYNITCFHYISSYKHKHSSSRVWCHHIENI